MGKLVRPEVYLIGETTILPAGLEEYLRASGNLEFLDQVAEARAGGLSDGEVLTSFYAKLCYASLTLGKNKNVSRTRDIEANLAACTEQGHGSVFDHAVLNFVARNCSRVFTHELVRHRVGSAFSQTSGRYVRGDSVDIVFDPILAEIADEAAALQNVIEAFYRRAVVVLDLDHEKDFAKKKKLTSALRRFLPNGQSNEIGFSLNLRTIRHVVMMRTSRHAEWEIREVFGQVYHLLKDKYPMLFRGAREELVDGVVEVSGIRMQPYEIVKEE